MLIICLGVYGSYRKPHISRYTLQIDPAKRLSEAIDYSDLRIGIAPQFTFLITLISSRDMSWS
jgi:hypothetical protein